MRLEMCLSSDAPQLLLQTDHPFGNLSLYTPAGSQIQAQFRMEIAVAKPYTTQSGVAMDA